MKEEGTKKKGGSKSSFNKVMSKFSCKKVHSVAQTTEIEWELKPLTPIYNELEHGKYVNALNKALQDNTIHNLALSGGYGVGKSSILQRVAATQRDRLVELSLSTLAPLERNVAATIPKQATTPTNRIQQEIVKQLLYREDPSKTPASRFRRIEIFNWRRELTFACLFGFISSLVFLLTGWTNVVANEIASQYSLGIGAHVLAFLFTGTAGLTFRFLFHDRIHINQVKTGAATVTLDSRAPSYFDQYLDEIVYFFQVSKTDIVIFEDIDRFNDAYIFETLRSLNTLLNKSPQIGKPIRFIYAIKDSIFDQLGLAKEGRYPEIGYENLSDTTRVEVVRANRTKFFDLVIPVVPFITHLNAKSLAHKLLDEIEHKIAPQLIDLAAKYVPDMRLLINIRNEFIVFRDRLFSGEGEKLRLTETELFAMMLYKCTHLADFEKIRISESRLDRLYAVWRNLIAVNIQVTEREIRSTRNSLNNPEHITQQSKKLGDRLIKLMKLILMTCRYPESGQYFFGDRLLSEDDLRSFEFWSAFVQHSAQAELKWVNHRNNNQQITYTRAQISSLLDARLEPKQWNKPDIDELNETLMRLQENLGFLKSADMGDMIKRPEFEIKGSEDEKSLANIAKEFLSSELAFQLVQSGYINQNFTLYTSTFHGNRVTPAATNFIIHHVQPNMMDEYFILNANDVEAIIGEVGEDSFREPALYNISIMDHLLRNYNLIADTIIRSLAQLGEQQRRFMQAYLGGAEERLKFVKRFAGVSVNVLEFCITQLDLDVADRLTIVNSALNGLDDQKEYRIGPEVARYLNENYASIEVLVKTHHPNKLEKIAKIFSGAKIRVPNLAPLTEKARQAFIADNIYQINKENLEILFVNDMNMSLDTALHKNDHIYSYLIDNMKEYLSSIAGRSVSVSDNKYFSKIIEDVLQVDGEQLDELIFHSSKDCKITDLEEIPEEAWSALAQNKRFPATFSNISNYVNSIGSVDSNLAGLLIASNEIIEHESNTQEDKEKLSIKIIATSELNLTAYHRARLVSRLNLENYLQLNSIPLEEGELFSQLVKHNIIADDVECYNYLKSVEWPTRELLIKVSKKFREYVSADTLNEGDIAPILISNEIDNKTKSAIVAIANENPSICDGEALSQLAIFAVNHELTVSINLIESMAQHDVSTELILHLLRPNLKSVSQQQLFHILDYLDGDYPKLTSLGWETPKIPNNASNIELLEVIKSYGIVSKFDRDIDPIKVSKRRKLK